MVSREIIRMVFDRTIPNFLESSQPFTRSRSSGHKRALSELGGYNDEGFVRFVFTSTVRRSRIKFPPRAQLLIAEFIPVVRQ